MQQIGGRLLKARPVLVVQNDDGNRNGTETIVAGIRGQTRGKGLPVHVEVRRGTGGLDKDSVVDAGQLSTVGMDALGRRIGSFPEDLMEIVDRALEISLGLEP